MIILHLQRKELHITLVLVELPFLISQDRKMKDNTKNKWIKNKNENTTNNAKERARVWKVIVTT